MTIIKFYALLKCKIVLYTLKHIYLPLFIAFKIHAFHDFVNAII